MTGSDFYNSDIKMEKNYYWNKMIKIILIEIRR